MKSPGRDEYTGDDILSALGPPVAVISGVKIYDTKVLTDPPLNLTTYSYNPEKKALFMKYLEQPSSQLNHLFIGNALEFIDNFRVLNEQADGLFPPLEVTINVFKTIFTILYTTISPRYSLKENIRWLYTGLIFTLYPTQIIGLEFLAIPSYVEYRFKDEPDYLSAFKEVKTLIDLSYESLGYEFSYFGFVKKAHPLRMAKVGKIPLKPNTFEAFGLFHLAPNAYLEKAERINANAFGHRQNRRSCLRYMDNDIVRMGGWKKKDLVDAIKKSGLWKNVNNLRRNDRHPPGEQNMGIAFQDLGLADPFPEQQVVRGLGRTLYMPICYYETLYRQIYQTTDYIDWPLLCELNAVSLTNARKTAVEIYAAQPREVANASADEICSYIMQVATKRKQLTKSLAMEAKEAGENFVAQPGSRWVQPLVMQRRGPLGEFITPPTSDYEMYKVVKQYCENQQITKDQMISYTTALNIRTYLPENLDQYSKADICEYLLDFLLARAQKYESVFIDCADPAINVRHILNAATIMELGGIFPKDVSNLTKETACRIISNYIQLLRDTTRLGGAYGP